MARPTYVYLVAAIRRIWQWSPQRRACLKNAERCYICEKHFEEYQADHVTPVGPAPKSPPWVGWDGYLQRMMEGELKPACKECHQQKNKRETAERRKKRDAERRKS